MNWFLIAMMYVNFVPTHQCMEHKFYVSNTIVEYNPAIGNFEVTCKLFTDDFEQALSLHSGKNILLSSNQDAPQADRLIDEYLQNHFRITFNDRPVIMSYVGHESEVDLTYAYFEIIGLSDFNVMFVESSVFLEIYPEQKNIIDVRKDGWIKTAILTKDKQSEVIFR